MTLHNAPTDSGPPTTTPTAPSATTAHTAAQASTPRCTATLDAIRRAGAAEALEDMAKEL